MMQPQEGSCVAALMQAPSLVPPEHAEICAGRRRRDDTEGAYEVEGGAAGRGRVPDGGISVWPVRRGDV